MLVETYTFNLNSINILFLFPHLSNIIFSPNCQPYHIYAISNWFPPLTIVLKNASNEAFNILIAPAMCARNTPKYANNAQPPHRSFKIMCKHFNLLAHMFRTRRSLAHRSFISHFAIANHSINFTQRARCTLCQRGAILWRWHVMRTFRPFLRIFLVNRIFYFHFTNSE